MRNAAAERNKEPIRKVLLPRLDAHELLLELASGGLQHARHIAPALPGLVWQPSDADPAIQTYAATVSLPPNVSAPLILDVTDALWPVANADAIFTANLLHIAPLQALTGLMEGAARTLNSDGDLFIYGPFSVDGAHTSQGNVAFDAQLRARNPAWGIRDLDTVCACADGVSLALVERIDMPANNFLLHFKFC